MRNTGTRQRILDVALQLFLDRGYDATSLREIADELDFTKAALYYHFRSKDEILRVLLEPFEQFIVEFGARLTAADGLEGWAEVLEWVIAEIPGRIELYRLVARNRGAIAELEIFGADRDRTDAVRDVEAAAMRHPDVRERIKMIAALATVTGFDDWAPTMLETLPPEVLVEELSNAVRNVLGLRARKARPAASARAARASAPRLSSG